MNIQAVKQIFTYDGNIIKKGVTIGHGDPSKIVARGKFAQNVEGFNQDLDSQMTKILKETNTLDERIAALKSSEEEFEIYRLSNTNQEIQGQIKIAEEKLS